MPLRVHQDVLVTSQMLVEGDDVLLLPAATRYEQEGGAPRPTTERRIVFSPRSPRQVGEARSEWRLFAERGRARAARPERALRLGRQPGPASGDRDVVPPYAGIERARRHGRRRCSGAGATSAPAASSRPPTGGPASPSLDVAAARAGPRAMFVLATRRGKQFNSMVHADVDPLTGPRRDAVYIDEADAAGLGSRMRHAGAGSRAPGPFDGRPRSSCACPPAASRSTGPRATSSSPAVRIAGSRHRRCPDYNAVVTLEVRR